MKKPFALLWLLLGGVLVFSWVYLPTLSKYRDLKLQQDDLDAQIEKLTREVQETREERDLLKNDVEYLEKVIRGELGLVKPGEIVYKFVKEKPSPSPEPKASESQAAAASPSPSATPKPSPSPSGETFAAKPVAASPKPSVKPKLAVVTATKPKTIAAIKKTAPAVKSKTSAAASQTQEPSYPRRETR